ncbi:MAG: HAMP domain-containing histidine kinase [Acidobacteriia bacterium]|nr:HAMP domain-containing histidine kinase [Terriglobia bacterium]
MDLRRLRDLLLPDLENQDLRFLSEVRQLSHAAIRIMGWTEMALAGFVFVARMVTDALVPGLAPGEGPIAARAWQAVLVVLVAVLTLWTAETRPARSHSAFFLCLSGWISSAVVIGSSLALMPHASDEYISVHITTILLVAITVCPLRPLDTFLLGGSIWLAYVVAFIGGALLRVLDWNTWDPSHLAFLFLLVPLTTSLAAVLYAQRSASSRAQQESLRIAQELAAAPVRALLSENAISVGRLAAALTHELNTPLGALKSSIDTMIVLAAKQATAPPEQQPRLVTMQAELRRSVNDGMERLKKVIARLQRFIDLDHTERQAADLNELLGDVAVRLKPALQENVKLEFDFEPLPPLHCRPQQLTTVFSSLLSNAINAVNGEGRIVVSTRKVDSLARIRIEDTGRGMEALELETIFDPGFRVLAGRVSTGNWSLFSARQIVFEHGGEIQITSEPGKGTTVDVLLPI